MKKDVLWNSLGTSVWSFSSLILLVTVTRINGIEDSGLFSFVFALALIMFTVACYGGRVYQVSDHHQVFSTESYIALRLVTTLATIILTVLFVLLNHYDLQKSALVFVLVGQRMVDAIADVFYGVLQKNGRLYIAGRSLFYKSILSIFAFFLIDLLTKDVVLASLSLPFISLLFVLLYDAPQCRRVEQFKIAPWSTRVPAALSATFLPFVIAAFTLIFANISRYFIDIYHPGLQGYFGIIIMPLSLIILLFSFISTPVIVMLSNKFNSGEFWDLNRVVVRIISIMIGITLILIAITYFLGAPLLQVLFGVDFQAYVVDIVLVVVIGATLSITSLFTQIATIARRLRFTAAMYLLTTIVLVILCALFTEQQQIRGAIVAYVVASTLQLLMMGAYYLSLVRTRKEMSSVQNDSKKL